VKVEIMWSAEHSTVIKHIQKDNDIWKAIEKGEAFDTVQVFKSAGFMVDLRKSIMIKWTEDEE